MRAWCLTVVLALVAAGCNKGVSDKDLDFVNASDASGMLEGRSGILGLGGPKQGTFVDPRNADKWEEGHIPGAVHLPLQYAANHQDRLAGYDTLIVYGTGYNDPRADGMSKRLMELGFKNVHTLKGGLNAWKSEGFDVETGREGVFVKDDDRVN